jgi:uncharacterized protein (DUF1810 family)
MNRATQTDPYDLDRFVRAQNSVYEEVLSELKNGAKVSHWMWFIFPQIKGLGRSPISIAFAISSSEEAHAYLHHSLLGARLKECTRLVLLVEGRSIRQIFGSPDDMKFRSSMTLFDRVSNDAVFREAIAKYYRGGKDQATLDHLARLGH